MEYLHGRISIDTTGWCQALGLLLLCPYEEVGDGYLIIFITCV